MKKTATLILIFFTIHFCNATYLEYNKWTDFEGKIGKANIKLSLFCFENGTIKGNYSYTKYETKIELIGTLTVDKIVLTELINNKENGHFEGIVFTDNQDRFEGTWTDEAKVKRVEFKLTLSAICGGNFKNRYLDFYGTTDDVENFVKRIKKSILENDKDWIANHVSYPIKVTVLKRRITIKNKQQLITNFDNIFYKGYRNKIKLCSPYNLFNNYQGAMLGLGEIWINNSPEARERKFDYKIISINN
jgi:hypothetical protein